jgi:uncharacterized membrane protein
MKRKTLGLIIVVVVALVILPYVPANLMPTGLNQFGMPKGYHVQVGFRSCSNLIASPLYVLTNGAVGINVPYGYPCLYVV